MRVTIEDGVYSLGEHRICVCLFISRISQKLLNRFSQKSVGIDGTRTSQTVKCQNLILVIIWITLFIIILFIIVIIIIQTFVRRTLSASELNLRRRQSLGGEDG